MQHDFQAAYWDDVAEAVRFENPLDFEVLGAHVSKSARILDLGCGYGRLLGELLARGYRLAEGVETSAGMVARARRHAPGAKVALISGLPAPFARGSFEAVLLFHVLSSVPAPGSQESLIDEVVRLLRPGGFLYLSDLPLQSDQRNLDRYRAFASRFGVYGTFELPGGGVFRHHPAAWFDHLLQPFEGVWSRTLPMRTMHGHPVTGYQFLGRRC